MILLATLALALFAQAPAVPQETPLTLPTVVYPADARAARIQGTVHLAISVDPTGHVTAVKALDGPIQLQQAAIDAYSKAIYRPFLKDNHPTATIVLADVKFDLSRSLSDADRALIAQFEPLHTRCQQLSAAKDAAALDTCRQALGVSQGFSPGTELEARATAYNDLVLLLIATGKYDGSGKPVPNPRLPEAAILADQAVALVDSAARINPHTPAIATAYITRAEVRSLANELPTAAADCAVAEESLNTLLQDQGQQAMHKVEETENERAANYRIQLRDTMLLHAVILDRMHKTKEAKALRFQAEHI